MENILVVGANTRPTASSLSKLGYNIYSADHFGCQDLKPYVTDFKSILSQKSFESSGFFSQRFNPVVLQDIAADFVDLADSIICCSGAIPVNFPKHKIIGNRELDVVENKYKLFKKLKSKFEGTFKLPKTYLVRDIHDAREIAKANNGKKFLLKPLKGSGGVGIKKLKDVGSDTQFHKAILQEIVRGDDVSTSVLSSGDEARTILTSQQLIGNKSLGQVESYGYCGNITPYIEQTPQHHQTSIKEISEDIIKELKLVGSNGVDMVINNDEYSR